MSLTEQNRRVLEITEAVLESADWNEGDDSLTLDYTDPAEATWRIIIRRDEYPFPPANYAGNPVFKIGTGVSAPEGLLGPVYGEESYEHGGVDIHDAWDRMYRLVQAGVTGWEDTVDLIDRWLRIFHGGSAERVESDICYDGPTYLVFDTQGVRNWRGTGALPSAVEAHEWQAYLNNEVYGVEIQKQEDPNVVRREALGREFRSVLSNSPGVGYTALTVLALVEAVDLTLGLEPLEFATVEDIGGFYGLDQAKMYGISLLADYLVDAENFRWGRHDER